MENLDIENYESRFGQTIKNRLLLLIEYHIMDHK